MTDDDRIHGYASGLFEIARAEGELERVEGELHQIARAFETSEDLRATLGDQAVPTSRKLGVVKDLLGGRTSQLTIAAIEFVVAAGRGKELPAIADELAAVAAASRSREVAEVRVAEPIDDGLRRRLEEALERATGKKVEVKVVVDPDVVGGIVARIGDTVIDGSVRRRLDSLREALRASQGV